MKKTPVLFAFIIILLGCKKAEVVDMDLNCQVVARQGDDSRVTGKWKLVKVRTVWFNAKTEDYSCNKIIYNFKSDGTLIITSDTEEIDQNQSTYQYEFSRSPLYEGMDKGYTLKINLTSISCSISKGVMTLDDSPVDGPIRYLVRM